MNALECFNRVNELNSYPAPALDSRQLRAFAKLARTGSFTQTARELHLSQSAVSHSIKALEATVGCRLLDRLAKNLALTQAGEQLLQHTERIFAEMAEARAVMQQMGEWGRGRLRLCASTTACEHILPQVLREFKESFPGCTVALKPVNTPQAMERLRDHEADLALILKPERDQAFKFHPLFEDELAFLVSPEHPWAVAGAVHRAELPRQQYVLYSKASYTFRMVETFFRKQDIVLNTVIELGSMKAIKELVKLGLGVGILAPWVARPEIEARTLVPFPLGKRKLTRAWGIAHLRCRKLTLAEETFLGLCRSATENLT
jgi:LysR family transcriptional regulator, low CO2-responsive transcriptional regulator